MSIKNKIIKEKLPTHLAIIMDGNGRWAKMRGEHRIIGHQNGVEAVKETVEVAGEHCSSLKWEFHFQLPQPIKTLVPELHPLVDSNSL